MLNGESRFIRRLFVKFLTYLNINRLSHFLVVLIVALISPILIFEIYGFKVLCYLLLFVLIICLLLLFSSLRLLAITLLVGIVVGSLSFYLNYQKPYLNKFSDCSMTGKIIQINNNYLNIKAHKIFCQKKDKKSSSLININDQVIQYRFVKDLDMPKLGAIYHITGNLSPVKSKQNLYEFNYENYLIKKGIRLTSNKLNFQLMKNSSRFMKLKSQVQEAIFRKLNEKNASLIIAIVTGDKTKLSQKQKDIISKTNTQHLLAISGLHIAIIGMWSWIFIQFIFSWFRPIHKYIMPAQIAGLFSIVFVFAYAEFTGMHIPVQRAFIMFSFIVLSWIFFKPIGSSLLFAVVLLLIINPYVIYDGGFYLSFIATFVVITVSRYKMPAMLKMIFMQVAIVFVIMPISGYLFGSISFTGILSNILVIPWISILVLPMSVLSCVIDITFPSLATFFWVVTDFGTSVLWSVLTFFAEFSWRYDLLLRPFLATTIIAIMGFSAALYYKKLYLLALVIPILLPPNWFANNAPQIVVAESDSVNILVHNGKQAVLFNAGRKQKNYYQNENQSEKWLRYLFLHELQLTTLYLADNSVSNASAANDLIKYFPNIEIVSLSKNDYPYETSFCRSTKLENLIVNANIIGGACQVDLNWYNRFFTLDIGGKINLGYYNNEIKSANKLAKNLMINDINYDTKKYGMLIIDLDRNGKLRLASVREGKLN